MKKWKNNLIAAAVLICVCAGIYVNWRYTEAQNVADLTDTLDSTKLTSDDSLLVDGDNILDIDSTTVSDYFAAVRLSRQQARDSAVGLLQEAMAYGEDAETAQSNEQVEEIVQSALCEAQIESLIVAKGYADCVAYISADGISVAVASPEGGLAQSDVAVIADVVMTQSDYSIENIRVVEVQ